MARPKKTIRTVFKNIGIPEDLWEKVKEELHSEIEGRIPFGAQQAFFTKLLREHFDGTDTHVDGAEPAESGELVPQPVGLPG